MSGKDTGGRLDQGGLGGGGAGFVDGKKSGGGRRRGRSCHGTRLKKNRTGKKLDGNGWR